MGPEAIEAEPERVEDCVCALVQVSLPDRHRVRTPERESTLTDCDGDRFASTIAQVFTTLCGPVNTLAPLAPLIHGGKYGSSR